MVQFAHVYHIYMYMYIFYQDKSNWYKRTMQVFLYKFPPPFAYICLELFCEAMIEEVT